MDYWNPNHVPTNAAAKVYRWVAPGAQTGAKLQKLDEKIGTDPFSVRYYHRDREWHTRPFFLLLAPFAPSPPFYLLAPSFLTTRKLRPEYRRD